MQSMCKATPKSTSQFSLQNVRRNKNITNKFYYILFSYIENNIFFQKNEIQLFHNFTKLLTSCLNDMFIYGHVSILQKDTMFFIFQNYYLAF